MGPDVDGEAAGDTFGHSVSLSADGSRLAVGGFENDGSGTDAGHVRVFDWDTGTSAWVQVGADIDGEAAGDGFGVSVSLSADGSRLAVGGYRRDGNGTDAGHVRVLDWNAGSSTWVQLGADIDGEAAGDEFGVSASLSADGSRLAAGGWYKNARRGHVRIFELDPGSSTWVQLGADIDGEAAGDEFGVSASLSADGSRLAAGGSLNDGNGTDAGHARVFRLIGETKAFHNDRRLPRSPACGLIPTPPFVPAAYGTRMEVTSTPSAGATYVCGERIQITLKTSTPVTFTGGSPGLRLSIGGSEKIAALKSGSGTASLEFEYVVERQDMDTDGLSIMEDPLSLGGAVLSDSAGAVVSWGLPTSAVSHNSSHKAQGEGPRRPPGDSRAGRGAGRRVSGSRRTLALSDAPQEFHGSRSAQTLTARP